MLFKMNRTVQNTHAHARIDGVVPGLRGQRAFPIPQLRTFDPFVMLDHIGPQMVGADYFVDGANSAHPHRGFETITFMFEGVMQHVDSMGNRATLHSASVQRMNAGRGIQHGGDFAADPISGRFHEVQLWVNLPAAHKWSEPEIQNVAAQHIPVVQQGSAKLRVIAGELLNQKGPITTTANIAVVHLASATRQTVRIPGIPKHYNALAYVLEGRAQAGATMVPAFHSAVFHNDGDAIVLELEGEVLLIAGQPIGEPVVMGGPFVMNTTEEIDQAYLDFKAGKFGTIEP